MQIETKGKKEAFYSMFFSILSKISTYILLLILANLFLKEIYGKVAFVMSIFNLILFVCVMGAPDALVPWIIRKKDTNSVFYFLMSLSLVVMVIGIIILWDHKWALPIVFTLPFLALARFSNAYLFSRYKYHLVDLAGFLYIVLSVIFIYLFRSYQGFGIILGYSIGYVLISFFLIYLARKNISEFFVKFKYNFPVIREYVKKALATSLLAASFAFLGWIDSVILGWLSTFENVAQYNIAGPISNVVNLIPISVGLFLLTRTSELGDRLKIRKILKRTLRISFSFSLLGSIVLSSLAYLVINIFFPKYVGIEVFIVILLMGMVFFSLYHLIYRYLLGKLKPEKALLPILIAAVLNIVLEILLIPKFGLYGICIATLLSHLVAFTLLAIKIRVLKQFSLSYLLVLFIPLAYYMEYYGLLLLIVVVPLLFFFKLIKKGDVYVIIKTLKDILQIESKKKQVHYRLTLNTS